MWLLLAHPQVATRSCDHCQKFRYDESNGRLVMIGDTDKPVPRFEGERLPCHDGGCPKGKPGGDVALWPHNEAAYNHYRRCKAVGRFPMDEVVEHNAAVIAEVEAQWDQMSRRRMESLLLRSQQR